MDAAFSFFSQCDVQTCGGGKQKGVGGAHEQGARKVSVLHAKCRQHNCSALLIHTLADPEKPIRLSLHRAYSPA